MFASRPTKRQQKDRALRKIAASELDTYNDKPEHIKFIIDCYAAYFSGNKIYRAMQVKYKDDTDKLVSLSTIHSYRQSLLPLILERRKELAIQIPIIDPTQRFQYAQELYDMATDGIEARTLTGESYMKYDIKAGVSALKLAHEMSGKDVAEDMVSDAEIIRTIVREAYDGVSKDNPEWTREKVVEHLINELPVTAQPYIEELNSIN